MDEKFDILDVTSEQFIEQARRHGVARPAALDNYRDFYRRGESPSIPTPTSFMPITRREVEDDTIKFIQTLTTGDETETVILPYTSTAGRSRNTLCVSSQIGCAMGCTFCETAQMGLRRNLNAGQIIAQWYAARFELHSTIDNVVFMGMGEPMDNLEAVIRAIRILSDDNGPAIAPSRITVSTVGRVAGIRRLAELTRETGYRRLNLAVSINAPSDAIRSTLMPINRAEPMADLMNAMLDWSEGGVRRVLIEYVLIPGVNDDLEHAERLCDYLQPLDCTVNLIPYNPRRDSPWPAPDDESVERFTTRIAQRGQFVKSRRTMGRQVMAACGQLGNEAVRRRSTTP